MTLLKDPRTVALLLAATLTIMANATISPALPQIEALFPDQPNASLLTRLLVTAPALLVAVLAPFAGMAADRFGRRRLLLMGVLIYGIAGTAGLYLPSLPAILASRLLLGAAVALIMTSQAALVGDTFSGEARGRYMGYQMAAINFGGFLFMITAGLVAEQSPRLPFAVYGLALLYLPVIFRAISDPERAGPGDSAAPTDGDDPPWRLRMAGLCVLAGVSMSLFYVMPTQFPFYLETRGYDSPALSGMLLGALTLAGGAVALGFGRLRAHLGKGAPPVAGYLAMAAGFVVIAFSQELAPLALGTGLVGGGFGLVMPSFIALSLDIAPAARRGTASGALTMSIFLGQFLSPIAMQPIIVTGGYGEAFVIVAGLLAALALAMWLVLRRSARRAGGSRPST